MWWKFNRTEQKIDALTEQVRRLQETVDRILLAVRDRPAEPFSQKKYIDGICDKCVCRMAAQRKVSCQPPIPLPPLLLREVTTLLPTPTPDASPACCEGQGCGGRVEQ